MDKYFSKYLIFSKQIIDILQNSHKDEIEILCNQMEIPYKKLIELGIASVDKFIIISYYILRFYGKFFDCQIKSKLQKEIFFNIKWTSQFLSDYEQIKSKTNEEFYWKYYTDLIMVANALEINYEFSNLVDKIDKEIKHNFVEFLSTLLHFELNQFACDILQIFSKNEYFPMSGNFWNVGRKIMNFEKYFDENKKFNIENDDMLDIFSSDLNFFTPTIQDYFQIIKKKEHYLTNKKNDKYLDDDCITISI